MLTIFTIVLNGKPFIDKQLPIFQQLTVPWRWHIVEGVSRPQECTSWCAEVQDRWHKNWLSIEIVVAEGTVRDLIPKLHDLGAEGIIEYALNKVI